MKKVIKSIATKFGYEIKRILNPKFYPKEEVRYAWLTGLDIKTVIDVGAHEGQSAILFNKIFPTAEIHSFEPLVKCFEILQNRCASITNHKGYNFAVGNQLGDITFNVSEFSQSSSIYQMTENHNTAYPFTSANHPETVRIVTLDSIFSPTSLQKDILIKIDTQGYEKEVLMGAKNLIDVIKVVIIETSFVELYAGQPLFEEIFLDLGNKGFKYCGAWEQMLDPRNGQPLQQDSIFIRMK